MKNNQQRTKSSQAKKLLALSLVATSVVGIGSFTADVVEAQGVQYYYDKYNVENSGLWLEPHIRHTQGGTENHAGFARLATGVTWNSYSKTWTATGLWGDGYIKKGQVGYLIRGTELLTITALEDSYYNTPWASCRTDFRDLTEATQTKQRGSLVQSNIIANDGSYPLNGESSGYWYVRKGIYVANVAPTTPTLNVPTVQFEHDDEHIIGFNSTDANGDVITYTLEASYNDGASWSQLYKGTNKIYKYTVPNNQKQVLFRAVATDGTANSAYSTSTSRTIQERQYYWSKSNVETKHSYTKSEPREESRWEVNGYHSMGFDQSSSRGAFNVSHPGTYYWGTVAQVITNMSSDMKSVQLWLPKPGENGKWLVHILTAESAEVKGTLVSNSIKGGINAYKHNIKNPDGFWYELGQRVALPDTTPPIIELTEQENYALTSTVEVKVHDLSAIKKVKYAKGNQSVGHFTSNGTDMTTSFTATENGEYTVFAEDVHGNKAVVVYKVTKVNTKPVVSSAVTSTPYAIIDETTTFHVKGSAHDPDGHDMTVEAKHLNATGNAAVAGDQFDISLAGKDYVNGFYTDAIKIVANDGFVNGEAYSLANPIIIRVNNAADYNSDLASHTSDTGKLSAAQHEAFYYAYKSIFNYESLQTPEALTDAQNKISNLKTSVGISESKTLTNWSNRLDLVTATVAMKIAEGSLERVDFENALALVEGIVASTDKDLLVPRLAELTRYHTAKDALIVMKDNPSIVSWDTINEAQGFINVVENKVNKSSLQKELTAIIKKFMSNITTVTPEDLIDFDVDNVNPDLGGMYDEYLDTFQPPVGDEETWAQDLVDFVNALNKALQDVTPSTVSTFHGKVPSYATAALQPITDAVDSLLEYRQTFLREDARDGNLATLVQAVSFNLTNDYMNTMISAMQEVIEYNVTHDDKEKEEGVTAILSLWEGQLKTDMQAYLDNGIPEILIVEDPYEYINDGSFSVIGSIQDSNDSTHEVEVTFNGVTKTTTASGSFTVTFDGLADGVHESDITIVAKDSLTSKIYTITKIPVITVSSVEIFKQFGHALSNDLSQAFDEIDSSNITSLKTIFDDTTNVSIDSSDRKIRDIENAAQDLSGQEEGELETLVKSIFLNIRLDWMINNYSTAKIEDFAWAGIDGVNSSNIADLVSIIDDYVAQFLDGNVVTPGLNDYQDWLTIQSTMDQARADIESSELISVSQKLSEAIAILEMSIASIPDWITAKKELQDGLDALINYYNALISVETAETTYGQSDKDAAQIVVDALPENTAKDDLKVRLDIIQLVIDAITAVELAEFTLDEANQLAAQILVNKLPDEHPMKSELQNRLNAVSDINNAITAVTQAESSYMQADKDAAYALVNALAEGLKKAELESRLVEVQKVLDAVEAVAHAEFSLVLADIEEAQLKIDAVADGNPKKVELQNTLDAINALRLTIEAVDLAESTFEQTDKDAAQYLVDVLPDTEGKTVLQNRLIEVQKVIDALQAIEVAESSYIQVDKDSAQNLVDMVAEGPKKVELESRLLEVQKVLDAIEAVALAESSLLIEDISNAQIKVDAIADGNLKKAELQSMLDAIDGLRLTIEAVVLAESTFEQADKDAAQSLVGVLPDTEGKTALQNRLDEVQKVIDALQAIEVAETSYTQADKDSAQSLVDMVAEGPKKVELESRLLEVQKVLDAIEAVILAESSLLIEDISNAQIKVDAIADGNLKKTELQSMLDAIDGLRLTIEAVVLAESTFEQTDKDAAQILVDVLPDTEGKTALQNRLIEVQKVIDALQAIEVAETRYTQADKDSAQSLVTTLAEGPKKVELESRLLEVQKVLDAIEAVTLAESSLLIEDISNAQTKVDAIADGNLKKAELQSMLDAIDGLRLTIEAVVLAESTFEQTDKDAAQNLVDALPDTEVKTALQNRLDEVQKVIDALQAIEVAETSYTQADKDVAQSLVATLAEGPKKVELELRLLEIQKVLDAIEAVAQAEFTLVLADIVEAQLKVDAVADDNPKKIELQEALNAINAYRLTIEAVDLAESTFEQGDKDAAQILVDALPDTEGKIALQNRLIEVQKVIDALQAIEVAETSYTQADKDVAENLVNALVDGTKKVELESRLLEVQKVLDAIEAVTLAESSLLIEDISNAQTKVDAIADGNLKKAELQSMLDAIDGLRLTIEAVVLAESTFEQTDKDAAQNLVDALPDTEGKTALQNRLDEVQKVIDALQAIEVAETSYTQADKDVAQSLVATLAEGPKKVELESRLLEVQKVLDAIEAVTLAESSLLIEDISNAQTKVDAIADGNLKKAELQSMLDAIDGLRLTIEAVVLAESTFEQADKDAAQNLVDALPDTEGKTALQNRLIEVQKVIDALQAIEVAESSYTQADKDVAQSIVDTLAEGPKKIELELRLLEVQKVLDAVEAVAQAELSLVLADIEEAQLKVDAVADGNPKKAELQSILNAIDGLRLTIEAVVHAESTFEQSDKNAAQSLVDILPDTESKTSLQNRLEEVQKVIGAIAAITQAETTYIQVDKDAAHELVEALAEGPKKVELESRLDQVQIVLDAIESVAQAESTLDLADILEAQLKVDAISDNNLKKAELQNMLDAIDGLRSTIEAVTHAETTYEQADKDTAQSLVDILPDTEGKTALQNRLDEVQKVIDALQAIEVAEITLSDSDQDTAQGLVDAIADSNPIKQELQERLDSISQLKDAIAAVDQAENTFSQVDKDAALELVNKLPSSSEKEALIDRLDELQKVIDKLFEEENATNAVEKAEGTFSQTDKDAALELVEALEDGSVKEALIDRLDELQAVLDSIIEIESVVAKAEASKLQEDVDTAQSLLDALTSSDIKSALQDRLDEVNRYIEAEKAVTKAEENHFQRVKDNAQALVDGLQEDAAKQGLQDRLDALQLILDGKVKDLLDEIINNPNDVTSGDLADYTDETVYEELMPDYMDEMDKIGDTITKDQVIEVVRLINKLEIAKRSMLNTDIQAYEKELSITTLPTKSNYPQPAVMSAISKYVKDDNELENVISHMAAELNRSIEEIREEITAILEGTKQLTGFYVVTYQTETGEIVDTITVEKIAYGPVDVLAKVPEGYALVGEDTYSFELTKENKGHEVVFIVEEDLAEKGEYSVKYQLEDGTIIFESVLTASYGELTITADVPKGFTLVDAAAVQQNVEFEKDSVLEIVFVVKEVEEVTTGSYLVQYVLEDLTVIHESTFTNDYGNVNVTAVVPEGYTLLDTEDLEKDFELDEDTEGTVIQFIVQLSEIKVPTEGETELPTEEETGEETELPTEEENDGSVVPDTEVEDTAPEDGELEEDTPSESVPDNSANPSDEIEIPSDEEPEIEDDSDLIVPKEVISNTIGDETAFVRSLMQVASLDTLYLTATPYVANADDSSVISEDHAEYLYKAFSAIASVKAYLNNPTEDYKVEVVAYIATNLHDGAFKKLLLDYLEFDITDIGDDGEPDLTPVNPTRPTVPPTTPTTPPTTPEIEGPTEKPEEWHPPVTEIEKPTTEIEKPTIEIPAIPGGETEAETEKVIETEVEGGYEWTIVNPTEKTYTLNADGIEIVVPLEIDASKWDIKWIHVGNEHYQLSVLADGKAVTTFVKPIIVTKTHSQAYLLRSLNGEYSAMPYTYNSGAFKFDTKKTGEFYFSTNKVTFKDVQKVYSKDEIEELASRHIVFGVNSNKYSPNAKLTRAQFAAMLTRSLGLEATDNDSPFKDTKGKWFEKEVQALYEAGIISGTSATTFNPNAYVTRQQAAAMLEKVLAYSDSNVYVANLSAVATTNSSLNSSAPTNVVASTFDDSYQIADYAKNAVGLLQSLGVVSGKEGNQFDPLGYLTRAQMAKVLSGTLNFTDKF